uniref:Ig-like domain-containing protein n=1 Tax=Labrus bergylta TaxID=56723 RepID=A0A3Q3F884_9LABR
SIKPCFVKYVSDHQQLKCCYTKLFTLYDLITLCYGGSIPQHRIITANTSSPDAPKLPSVSVSPSAEIVEGSSVTLTCSSDANPAPEYTWFKENNNQPLSREAQLVFSSIKSSDSGEYLCKAENDLGKPTYKWISIDIQPAEEQDELQYATVDFSRNQADPLYSNIQPVKPQTHKKKKKEEEEGEQEEMVEYSVVNFNSGGSAQR